MAFNKYFQDELKYLRQLGAEFSRTYPALAPMLADRGGDPDVERLLEGVAFLTGRVRQKLDDELPELMLAVSSLLFPQLVRPLPASAILELSPLQGVLRERRTVPRGTEFDSVPIDGTRCRFTSTDDCELAPLQLSGARLESPTPNRQQLRLTLTGLSGTPVEAAAPPRLRLHLAAQDRSSGTLLLWLLRHVDAVRLEAAGQSVPLPKGCFEAVGFEEGQSLLPWSETGFPGFRLLQEYYVLPAKFHFVDLVGLGRCSELGNELAQLDIVIEFDRPLPDVRDVSASDVKLHCVPVINVFETTAEPVRLDAGREQHVLRVAGHAPSHGEVYALKAVRGSHRNSSESTPILPFYNFEHAAGGPNAARPYYSTHLRPSVVTEGADFYIAVGTAEDSGLLADFDFLSIDLLATNGSLANAVRSGEINVPTPSSPPYAKFRNLTAVTRHVPPPLGQELQWRATAHTAMNLRSLAEPAVLRSILGVYNLQAISDRQAARAHELRVEALRDVRVRPAERLIRGAPVRGIHLEVELGESGFAGDGDVFLFGCVLDRLFAEYVSLNSFAQTSVTLLPSKAAWSWPPRSGARTLL